MYNIDDEFYLFSIFYKTKKFRSNKKNGYHFYSTWSHWTS